MRDLHAAHTRFVEELFAVPARRHGAARWGIKEVRLTAAHARYLRWLFPKQRLIFLHRNPYDCYRSYRQWKSWYLRWPDDPVIHPERFGEHWRTLVAGYLENARELDALVVRYEDLVADSTLIARVCEHADLAPPDRPLDRIASRRRRGESAPLPPLPDAEVERLKAVVEPVAAALGYSAH